MLWLRETESINQNLELFYLAGQSDLPLVIVEEHRDLAGVGDTVGLVCRTKHHRTGLHFHGLAIDEDFGGTLGDHQELLLLMLVRWVALSNRKQKAAPDHRPDLIGRAI